MPENKLGQMVRGAAPLRSSRWPLLMALSKFR
jgi:hypothetical protein